MSFATLLREDRRLAILDFLLKAPGGQLNIPVVQSALKSLGHQITRNELDEEVVWLADRGLLIRDYEGPVQILTITERGADVAGGILRVEGIKRPAFRS